MSNITLPALPDLSGSFPGIGNPTGRDKFRIDRWKTNWVVKGHILAGGYPLDEVTDDLDSRLGHILVEGAAPEPLVA
jgi:hypothetical protein